MKFLRYLIFLSILSGVFFVIYRQSDAKGFRKWWVSLKMAVLIAAILTGIIPSSTQAEVIKPSANNNPVYHERLLSEREFNLFEDNDRQVILVGRDSSGNSSNVPSNIGRQGQSPSNFLTPPSGECGGFDLVEMCRV